MRAELIAGELYVTPAPRPDHQRALGRLWRALDDHTREQDGGEALLSPVDVYLPSGDVLQPDIVVLGAWQADLVREDGIHGAPRLLIEVVSATHAERDRLVKHDLYARNGVSEYWIVDPAARSVEVFVLAERRYEPRGWFTGEAQIVSPSLRAFDLPVPAVFP